MITAQKDTTLSKHVTSNGKDVTATVLGDFGKWQLKITFLMSMLKLPMAWYQLNIIFMAPPQDFWCKKPAEFAKYSDDEWRKISSPVVEEHPCLVFDPDVLSYNPSMNRELINLVPCKQFVFDNRIFNRTITSEWALVCSKHWMIHFTQCVMMWGVLLGGIFFAYLADKHGRKGPLLAAIILQSICSFITAMIPMYWGFLFVWFILALASGGTSVISFVICMEVVSGKWRTIIPVLYQMPFGLGNAVMAVLAHWLRDWRKLEIGLATLSSLYILYCFCITESPRWLFATGQTEKAVEVLKKAAKQNKRDYDFEKLLRKFPAPQERPKAPGFILFMKYKNMRMKTLLLASNWFCMGVAFYSFSQYLGSLSRNIFLMVAMSGIISLPGAIICVFIIAKFGRKTTLTVFSLLTGISFLCILLTPRDVFCHDWPRFLFAGLGLTGMAGNVPALYLFSGELYPTLGRNVGVSGVATFSRIGSMVAPVIVSLDNYREGLPLILLAIVCCASVLLLVPLPETKDCPLPDTIEEAEKFTKTSY